MLDRRHLRGFLDDPFSWARGMHSRVCDKEIYLKGFAEEDSFEHLSWVLKAVVDGDPNGALCEDRDLCGGNFVMT
ncbi:hypothetical protein A2U01_0074265, partial [Trifolium medium]|nr:hypothetical protein [Trifolium medium]